MKRSLALALLALLLMLFTPRPVRSDSAHAPQAKTAAPSSVQASISDAPQQVAEASGPVFLVKPGSRFLTIGPGALAPRGDLPNAAQLPGRTMIAPFPVPGDPSRAATERRKALNVPKAGVTTIAPLPAPPGVVWEPYSDGSVIPGEEVDVLPEQSITVPPIYPKAARDAGVQGTVKVRAHVRADGTVDATVVVHSIPGLDEAAVQCVKAWRFKPASFHGKPVAVWVGVPVKFTLH